MAVIDGIFQRGTVWDTRGSTNNFVGGAYNDVAFRGDHGANNFSLGGFKTRSQVNNLGRDDHVNLRGPGWVELRDGNNCDGKVNYYNMYTGAQAQVKTDGGRNDDFVRARVSGANGAVPGGDWNCMGNAHNMHHAWHDRANYNQGYRDGYNDRRAHEGFGLRNFFRASVSLNFGAWFG